MRLLGVSAASMVRTLAVVLVSAASASGLRDGNLTRPGLVRCAEQSLGVALIGLAARLAEADP